MFETKNDASWMKYRQPGWIGTLEVNRDTCLKCLSWPKDRFKQVTRFTSSVPIHPG